MHKPSYLYMYIYTHVSFIVHTQAIERVLAGPAVNGLWRLSRAHPPTDHRRQPPFCRVASLPLLCKFNLKDERLMFDFWKGDLRIGSGPSTNSFGSTP